MVVSIATVRASCQAVLQRGVQRRRGVQRAGVVGAVVAAVLGIAACGGSSAPASSPTKLLSQTFTTGVSKIHSGVLSLTLDADLKGLKALGGKPISVVASGPFTEGGGSIAFDFSATVTAGSTTIPLGILATGQKLYIEFGGTYYALPAGSLGSGATPLPASTGASGVAESVPTTTGPSGAAGLLSRLDIEPLSWLTTPKIVGSATVGGVATEHLSAQVDIAKLVTDIGTLAKSVGGSKASSILSGANLSELASAVSSAQLDLYTGTSDHILREVRFALSFTVPPAAQSALDGVTAGSFTSDAQISDLNSPETVTAPKSSQPFSGLLSGAGRLFGL
jgi:hypothetical protein